MLKHMTPFKSRIPRYTACTSRRDRQDVFETWCNRRATTFAYPQGISITLRHRHWLYHTANKNIWAFEHLQRACRAYSVVLSIDIVMLLQYLQSSEMYCIGTEKPKRMRGIPWKLSILSHLEGFDDLEKAWTWLNTKCCVTMPIFGPLSSELESKSGDSFSVKWQSVMLQNRKVVVQVKP